MRIARVAALLLVCVFVMAVAGTGRAVDITYSGMVSYSGAYTADSLYVVVIDTTANFGRVGHEAIDVGPPPFNVPYSITFDNAGLAGPVLVAGILDVDGSGFDTVDFPENILTEGDILGWYPSEPIPVLLPGDISDSGLSFWLPTGEIHGSMIFSSGMTDAEVEAISEVECGGPSEWSPPITRVPAQGSYSVVGLYAGNWCVSARSFPGGMELCYDQDLGCASPTLVGVAAGQIVTGIDFDFSITPTEDSSWGLIKNLYR